LNSKRRPIAEAHLEEVNMCTCLSRGLLCLCKQWRLNWRCNRSKVLNLLSGQWLIDCMSFLLWPQKNTSMSFQRKLHLTNLKVNIVAVPARNIISMTRLSMVITHNLMCAMCSVQCLAPLLFLTLQAMPNKHGHIHAFKTSCRRTVLHSRFRNSALHFYHYVLAQSSKMHLLQMRLLKNVVWWVDLGGARWECHPFLKLASISMWPLALVMAQRRVSAYPLPR
jgi:hypothetical protein